MNIHNRVILDFNAVSNPGGEFQDLRMQVYCDVRVKGIAILNPSEDCKVSNFMLHNETMMHVQNWVPGKFFAYPGVKLLDELKTRIRECPELAPITSWIGNKVVTVGHNVHLQVSGKYDSIIVWGDAVHFARPMHDIKVSPCDLGNGHKGVKAELKVRRWDDEEWHTAMEVCTLSEPGALTLIQSELQKYNRMFG